MPTIELEKLKPTYLFVWRLPYWYYLGNNNEGQVVAKRMPELIAKLTGVSTKIKESDFGDSEKVLLHLQDDDKKYILQLGRTIFAKELLQTLVLIPDINQPICFGARAGNPDASGEYKVHFPIILSADLKTDFTKLIDWTKKERKSNGKINWDKFIDIDSAIEEINSKIKVETVNYATGEVEYPIDPETGEPIF